MNEFIRVIGDVHGCVNTLHPRKKTCYTDIISDCTWSIQLGDMAFNYSGLNNVPLTHRFIPGNHDNYDIVMDLPHSINYGMITHGPFEFFAVRGAWSIDIRHRLTAMNKPPYLPIWWPQEELTDDEMENCLEIYSQTKPDVVMAHTCPQTISELVNNPSVWKYFGWDAPRLTRTQQFLQKLFDEHQPKLWLFGHYHRVWLHVHRDTTFICVDELEFMDFNKDWEIV